MSAGRTYHVARVLGRGGFGVVYLAKFQGEGDFIKNVALKILNPNLISPNSDIVRRLRDEARILGLLNHRAIVQVDRLIELHGRWTVVMEYAEGVDLSRILRGGPVPAGAAMEIGAEVAGALHAAYTRQKANGESLRLHHRDIKPSNLQITPFGAVKVLDFGIARADFDGREAHSTRLGGRFGTPAYMPPERLYLKTDGPEGDIYALGTVLFEMLTGREFGHACRTRERHQELLAESMAALRAVDGVDTEISALLGAMLDWDPGSRPTASQVERRCISLRGRPGGEPLRYWAERVVNRLLVRTLSQPPREPSDPESPNTAVPADTAAPPEMAPQPESEEWDDDLTGMVLEEGSLPAPVVHGVVLDTTFPPGSLTTTAFRPWLGWRGAAVLAFLVAAGIVWAVLRAGPAPEIPAVQAPEIHATDPSGGGQKEAEDGPATAGPTSSAQTEGSTASTDKPSTGKKGSGRGGPKPPTETGVSTVLPPVEVSPVDVPAPQATVTVRGDPGQMSLTDAATQRSVELQTGQGVLLAPGSYTLSGSFSDGTALPTLLRTLHDGDQWTLECQTQFHNCKEK